MVGCWKSQQDSRQLCGGVGPGHVPSVWHGRELQAGYYPHPGCISHLPLKQPLEYPMLSFHAQFDSLLSRRPNTLANGGWLPDISQTWQIRKGQVLQRWLPAKGLWGMGSDRHEVSGIFVSLETFPAHCTQIYQLQDCCFVHFLSQNLNSSEERIALTLALQYIKGI